MDTTGAADQTTGAREILGRRYANGEINQEEYQRMKQDLQDEHQGMKKDLE